MTHLLVHIFKEIGILGPVFLHNMFPFERYMSVLKMYVRKRSSSEGCIAKDYATEEVIEFCTDYVDELRPIGVPLPWHDGRLEGKGTLGKGKWSELMTTLHSIRHIQLLCNNLLWWLPILRSTRSFLLLTTQGTLRPGLHVNTSRVS